MKLSKLYLIFAIVTVMVISSVYADTLIDLPFNSVEGTYNSTFAENLGSGNDFNATKATYVTAGYRDEAYNTTGTGGLFALDFLTCTTNCTVLFAVKNPVGASGVYMAKYDTLSDRRGWSTELSAGQFKVLLSTDGAAAQRSYITDSEDLDTNEWYTAGFTWNSDGQLWIYINGTNVTTTKTTDSAMTTINNPATNITIGYRQLTGAVSSALQSTIDEILVLNSTYSQAQVLAWHDTLAEEPTIPQTEYYFSNSGSDSNNGTLGFPLKTIAKYNLLQAGGYINAGDTVYFDCNSTLKSATDAYINLQSGSTSGNVTYASYGNCNGRKAHIYGGYNASLESDWVDAGSNKWNYTTVLPFDVANIVFNATDDFYSGVGAWNKTNRTAGLVYEHDFMYNTTTHVLTVLSAAGNPATHSDSVWIMTRKSADDESLIDYSNDNYIVIKDLDLRYYGGTTIGGIGTTTNQHHIYIINNSVSWSGGVYQYGTQSHTLRYGNGIDISGNAHHILIDKNKVYQIYDAGITYQSWANLGAKDAYEIDITNNIVTHSDRVFEIISSDSGSSLINMTLSGNTFYGGGYEWRYASYPEARYPRILMFSSSPTETYGIVMTDNIFANALGVEYLMGNYVTTAWDGQAPSQDYNLWYNGDGGTLINYNATAYTSLALFQAAKGQELNGIETDPLFTDVANFNFTPSEGSPACTASSTGSYVGAEPCDCVTPVDDLVLTENTTLCGGRFEISDSGTDGVIKITASDVILDCNGASLAGDNTGYGIVSGSGKNRYTIKNCNIIGYARATNLFGNNSQVINNNITNSVLGINYNNFGYNVNISNNRIYNSTNRAISVPSYCYNATIANNNITQSIYAIWVEKKSNNSNVFGNRLYNNTYSVYLLNNTGNSIYNNQIINSSTISIVASSPINISIYNNNITNSPYGIHFDNKVSESINIYSNIFNDISLHEYLNYGGNVTLLSNTYLDSYARFKVMADPVNVSINETGLHIINLTNNGIINFTSNINHDFSVLNSTLTLIKTPSYIHRLVNVTNGLNVVGYTNQTITYTVPSSADLKVEYTSGDCIGVTDDMNITSNVSICRDTYYVDDSDGNGAIHIGNNNIVLDCNFSSIIGSNSGKYINSSSYEGLTIINCNFTQYKGGTVVLNDNSKILNSNIKSSNNITTNNDMLIGNSTIIFNSDIDLAHTLKYSENEYPYFSNLIISNSTLSINDTMLGWVLTSKNDVRNTLTILNSNVSNLLNRTVSTYLRELCRGCNLTLRDSYFKDCKTLDLNGYDKDVKWTIVNNTIVGGRYGITMQRTNISADTFTNISGNTFNITQGDRFNTETTDYNYYGTIGIYWTNIKNGLIYNNTIFGSGYSGYGINGANWRFSNITIDSNKIYLAAKEGIYSFAGIYGAQAHIALDYSGNSIVRNNYLEGDMEIAAINLGDSSDNRVYDNTINITKTTVGLTMRANFQGVAMHEYAYQMGMGNNTVYNNKIYASNITYALFKSSIDVDGFYNQYPSYYYNNTVYGKNYTYLFKGLNTDAINNTRYNITLNDDGSQITFWNNKTSFINVSGNNTINISSQNNVINFKSGTPTKFNIHNVANTNILLVNPTPSYYSRALNGTAVIQDWTTAIYTLTVPSSNLFTIQYASSAIPPTVTLNDPVNGYSSLTDTKTINFSCTVTDIQTIYNLSLYIWYSNGLEYANVSVALNTTSNTTNWTVYVQPDGNYIWNCKASNAEVSGWGTNRTFEMDTYNFISGGNTITPALSNVTYVIPSSGIYFISISVGNYCLNITGGTYAGNYCLLSTFPTSLNIGNTAANIYIYDEQNLHLIDYATTLVDVIGTGYAINLSTTNGTLTIQNMTRGRYEIRYEAPEYHPRTYFINFDGLSNPTVYLYLINESTAISDRVILTLVDEYNDPAQNIIIKLQRNFIEGNVSIYKTVSMSKTNFEGQAILYVEPYDIWYKMIYESADGNVYKTTDSSPFMVSNPTDSLVLTANPYTSWYMMNDIYQNLSVINESGNFYVKYTYNDLSNFVRTGCLEVQRVTAKGVYQICSNCTDASSATISCLVDPTLSGQYKAVGKVDTNSNGSWYPIQTFFDLVNINNIPYGQEGVFMGAVLIGTMALMGVGAIVSSLIFVAMGFIGLVILHFVVGFTISLIIWIIALILIIIFMIMKSRSE